MILYVIIKCLFLFLLAIQVPLYNQLVWDKEYDLVSALKKLFKIDIPKEFEELFINSVQAVLMEMTLFPIAAIIVLALTYVLKSEGMRLKMLKFYIVLVLFRVFCVGIYLLIRRVIYDRKTGASPESQLKTWHNYIIFLEVVLGILLYLIAHTYVSKKENPEINQKIFTILCAYMFVVPVFTSSLFIFINYKVNTSPIFVKNEETTQVRNIFLCFIAYLLLFLNQSIHDLKNQTEKKSEENMKAGIKSIQDTLNDLVIRK